MNIVVPLGGFGRRFEECGYARPKPLIRASGKEILFWVLDSLRLEEGDRLFVPYNEHLDRHNFSRAIRLRYPRAEMVALPSTRGAADTVKMCIDHFGLGGRVVVLDGDTWYEEDIISEARRQEGNAVAYFDSSTPKPIYSYIRTDGDLIVEIKEKQKISDKAGSGCYVFSDAKAFSEATGRTQPCHLGEVYMSTAIQEMMDKGQKFRAFKVEKFHVLGTPEQLVTFARSWRSEKKRFCFDLDNTLVTAPRVGGDYSTVEPITETINHLKGLKESGHTIIIYTARRMRTHSGNVGAVVADVGKVTIDTLSKFEIPYDELHFGKPYAHFYVDDLMADPRCDLNKELGFYTEEVKARHFNKVVPGKTFKKTSQNGRKLQGEIHYHRWIQSKCVPEVREMFPAMVSGDGGVLETEAVDGLNFSTLYINEILKASDLRGLLSSLKVLHSHKEEGNKRRRYDNFSPKLKRRLSMYDHRAMGLSDDAVKTLCDELDRIADESFERVMIHGDPVFSNIMLNSEGKIKMVDMRGAEGDELTVFGHELYDFAKVYQSLCGYDEILLDKTVRASYKRDMTRLFEDQFDAETTKKIKKVTASLFLSLIPLHDDDTKKPKYAKAAIDLLKD